MNEYRTMGDVRLAAEDCGMTVEQFFAESYPEDFERVDWSDERPSNKYLKEQLKVLDERIISLENERRILRKWGHKIPEELDEWYSQATKRYAEIYWMIEV